MHEADDHGLYPIDFQDIGDDDAKEHGHPSVAGVEVRSYKGQNRARQWRIDSSTILPRQFNGTLFGINSGDPRIPRKRQQSVFANYKIVIW